MNLHNLDNLPKIKETEEEAIDSCLSMVSEFAAQEDSKGRANVFKKMTGQTPTQYWNNKDDMEIYTYESDKKKGQLMGDDTYYAGISANHNRLY